MESEKVALRLSGQRPEWLEFATRKDAPAGQCVGLLLSELAGSRGDDQVGACPLEKQRDVGQHRMTNLV